VLFTTSDAAAAELLLEAWRDLAVLWAVVLPVRALGRAAERLGQDDVPMFPSASDLLRLDLLDATVVMGLAAEAGQRERMLAVLPAGAENATALVVPVSGVFGAQAT